MDFKNTAITLVALLFILAGCHSQPSKSRGWSMNMRSMAESYEKLTPYMFDSQRYSDPKNEKFISLYLKNLNRGAAHLDQHTARGLSGDDPLFKVGLKGLKTLIQKANEAYFVESYQYSQQLLQTSMNYCSSCHSRTSIGPTFVKWDQFEDITSKLSAADHANLLVSTRQFPKAVSVLEDSLGNKDLANSQKIKNAKRALFVAIRNLNDKEKARSVVDALAKNSLSKKEKTMTKQWAKALQKMDKKEPPLRKVLQQRNFLNGRFVDHVLMTQRLHKGLSTELDRDYRSKIYYRLGRLYETFSNFGLWNLPETYFETCIEQSPGTKQAMKCYYALEARLNKAPMAKRKSPTFAQEKTNLMKLKVLASPRSDRPASSGAPSGSENL